MKDNKLNEIRQAVADYICSEFQLSFMSKITEDCRRYEDKYKIAERKLAELLDVPLREDNSRYDYDKFKTQE